VATRSVQRGSPAVKGCHLAPLGGRARQLPDGPRPHGTLFTRQLQLRQLLLHRLMSQPMSQLYIFLVFLFLRWIGILHLSSTPLEVHHRLAALQRTTRPQIACCLIISTRGGRPSLQLLSLFVLHKRMFFTILHINMGIKLTKYRAVG
jgi:DNA-binding helix-hairpin-helix protein with protein kinase domain